MNRREFLKTITATIVAANLQVAVTQRTIYAQMIGPITKRDILDEWPEDMKAIGLKWLDINRLYGCVWIVSDNIIDDLGIEGVFNRCREGLEKHTGHKFILGRESIYNQMSMRL